MDPYHQTYDPTRFQDPDPQYHYQQQHYHYDYSQPQPQQQFSYFPQQEQSYETVYSNQQQEIYPPGVTVKPDPSCVSGGLGYGYGQDGSYSYSYQNQLGYGYYSQQQQQQQVVFPDSGRVSGQGDVGLVPSYPSTGQTPQSVAGRTESKPFRGAGTSSRGRGRGNGRGGKSTSGQVKSVKPPPQMVWCELCRVDCNTQEMLENHKNGKKHMKSLKQQEALQLLAEKTQEAQVGSTNVSVLYTTNPSTEESKQPGQGRGTKRKATDGPETKSLNRNDGSRKSAEPPKTKEVVPFICELCNAKCDTATTFNSHLKGKKHLFNVQIFQEQQAALQQAAFLALPAALEALYPLLLQAVSQQLSTDSILSSVIDPEQQQQLRQWLQSVLPQTGPALPQDSGAETVPPSDQAQGQQESVIDGVNAGAETKAPNEVAEGVENPVEPGNKTNGVDSCTVKPTQ